MVVRAPRGPIDIDAPRFPRLIEIPGRIFIRFWNLKPILNFLVSTVVYYTIFHPHRVGGNELLQLILVAAVKSRSKCKILLRLVLENMGRD